MDDCPLKVRERIKAIKSEVLTVDDKIDELTGLLGHSPYAEPPKSIFIFGDSGTGKTLTLTKCLQVNNYAHATVNCIESYDMEIIYESILDQLTGHKLSSANGYKSYVDCCNMLEFVLQLQKISKDFGFNGVKKKSIILVFDKCEKLRSANENIIPAFVKLRELTKLKICSVFVCSLPWSRFCPLKHVIQPITIFFGQYDRTQLQKILMLSKPENVSESFYDTFLNFFLDVFYVATRDVRELQYQASVTFDHYYKPIKNGELSDSDTAQLWERSQAFFNKALRYLYLKVDCSMDFSEFERITSMCTKNMIMELPHYTKYLLIGSYIASYNPATADKRMFVKQKKPKKAKSEKAKLHLKGPEPFGLERLIAIVAAILKDEKFDWSADIFVEVANLVRMKLITQISEDILEPTYKCNVNFQFIEEVSKDVEFPIRKYLVDFVDSDTDGFIPSSAPSQTISNQSFVGGSTEQSSGAPPQPSIQPGSSSALNFVDGSSEQPSCVPPEPSIQPGSSSCLNIVDGSSEQPSVAPPGPSIQPGSSSTLNFVDGSSEQPSGVPPEPSIQPGSSTSLNYVDGSTEQASGAPPESSIQLGSSSVNFTDGSSEQPSFVPPEPFIKPENSFLNFANGSWEQPSGAPPESSIQPGSSSCLNIVDDSSKQPSSAPPEPSIQPGSSFSLNFFDGSSEQASVAPPEPFIMPESSSSLNFVDGRSKQPSVAPPEPFIKPESSSSLNFFYGSSEQLSSAPPKPSIQPGSSSLKFVGGSSEQSSGAPPQPFILPDSSSSLNFFDSSWEQPSSAPPEPSIQPDSSSSLNFFDGSSEQPSSALPESSIQPDSSSSLLFFDGSSEQPSDAPPELSIQPDSSSSLSSSSSATSSSTSSS